MYMEKIFQEFINNQTCPIDKKMIDYFGVNISTTKDEPDFKIYYAECYRGSVQEKIYDFLLKNNMLRHCEVIADSSRTKSLRYDYAIKNRNTDNMNLLLTMLDKYTDTYGNVKKIVDEMLQLKITDNKKYTLASLYHLGLVYKNGGITALKLYFFCKWYLDLGNPKENGEYRDEYYIDFLKNCEIKEYQLLSQIADSLIKHTDAHMWIVGCDSEINYKKYKIYLKNFEKSNLYILYTNKQIPNNIINKIIDLEAWMNVHEEYNLKGIALGTDDDQNFFINFYLTGY